MKLVGCGIVLGALALALANCSSSTSSTPSPSTGGNDAGNVEDARFGTDAVAASDGGSDVASPAGEEEPTGTPPGPSQTESEPNGGANDDAGVPQTNTMTMPGTMAGAINPADDADLFKVNVSVGDLWFLRVKPGAAYAPHLTVFDIQDNGPTRIVKASAGVESTLPYFGLYAGDYAIVMRDSRNVPSASSQHVGSPNHTYSILAYKTTPHPIAMALPSSVSGALPKVSSLAFYSFSAQKDQNVEIVLKAQRKQPPSQLDSRMSLFHVGSKTTILTNDNIGVGETDSEIRGPMPMDGDYWIVIENESAAAFDPNATPDLSFTLNLNLK